MLFRRDVAEDVKSLDQESRASIRRYGVRFGAYHIFLPALLKPAPAELITLLWALKNDGAGQAGYGELIPMLAAGRTSVVTDSIFRADLLQARGLPLPRQARGADRYPRAACRSHPSAPAVEAGTSPRPEGAYDGRRFVATTSMLSILGRTAG